MCISVVMPRVVPILYILCTGESVWVGVWCRVEVTVGGCEGASCGEGQWRGEERESMSDRVRARGMARKMAFSRACEDAFSHILLVMVPGKPTSAMVYIIHYIIITSYLTSPITLNVLFQVVQRAEEHARRLVGDLTSTCPPVTVLPWQPHDTSTCSDEVLSH